MIGNLVELSRQGHFDVLVHGCNCFNTMGAGIAREIARVFPQAFQADMTTVKADRNKLGTYSVARVERQTGKPLWVVNAYTQYHYGKPGKGQAALLDYVALSRVFAAIARDFPGMHIAYPRVGAGLAGGDWGVIQPIIEARMRQATPGGVRHTLVELPGQVERDRQNMGAPINIASQSTGLGAALTNMSERAREKGHIKHAYPVTMPQGNTYADVEQAYQHLKMRLGENIPEVVDRYNDRLMVDLVARKFDQHDKLSRRVRENGGAQWLAHCKHYTGAKSARMQSWEGPGMQSRFIRNLVAGYAKHVAGFSTYTHVVHVRHAPYDIYVARDMLVRHPDYVDRGFGNTTPIAPGATREQAVAAFARYVQDTAALKARVQAELWGKTLGCWCKKPTTYDLPCHAQVLAAISQGQHWEDESAQQMYGRPVQPSLF